MEQIGVEPMTDNPMSSAHQNKSGQGSRVDVDCCSIRLSYFHRSGRADLSRQPTVPITHHLRPAENQFGVLTGKRFRTARTKAVSALAESISNGEKPRCLASMTAIPIRAAVITIFGQALSAHWPDQVSCSSFENGSK